jgi:hypothetical protein
MIDKAPWAADIIRTIEQACRPAPVAVSGRTVD